MGPAGRHPARSRRRVPSHGPKRVFSGWVPKAMTAGRRDMSPALIPEAKPSVFRHAAEAQLRLKLPRKFKKTLGNWLFLNLLKGLFEVASQPGHLRVRRVFIDHSGTAESSFITVSFYPITSSGSDHFRLMDDSKSFVVSSQQRERSLSLLRGPDSARADATMREDTKHSRSRPRASRTRHRHSRGKDRILSRTAATGSAATRFPRAQCCVP